MFISRMEAVSPHHQYLKARKVTIVFLFFFTFSFVEVSVSSCDCFCVCVLIRAGIHEGAHKQVDMCSALAS